jgi:hypothetical protein
MSESELTEVRGEVLDALREVYGPTGDLELLSYEMGGGETSIATITSGWGVSFQKEGGVKVEIVDTRVDSNDVYAAKRLRFDNKMYVIRPLNEGGVQSPITEPRVWIIGADENRQSP